MRLAVTVGFDSRLVVRALANIAGRDLILVRGVTGGEGDERSRKAVEEILKVLGKGREHVVDLRDPAEGLRQLYELDFDEFALAGGPRLLVILGFVVAALKGSRIYVVPEFSSNALDITGLAALGKLWALSDAKLSVLAMIDGQVDAETVAHRLGIDTSTAYRHLDDLEELGIVKSNGKKRKKYETDKLVATLSLLILSRRRTIASSRN